MAGHPIVRVPERHLCYDVAHDTGDMNMTANAVVRARVDEKVKAEAAAVLEAVGLTTSDAVRLLLTRIAREKALPFDPLVPNETTIAAMREARAGKLETVTLDQLQAELDADD